MQTHSCPSFPTLLTTTSNNCPSSPLLFSFLFSSLLPHARSTVATTSYSVNHASELSPSSRAPPYRICARTWRSRSAIGRNHSHGAPGSRSPGGEVRLSSRAFRRAELGALVSRGWIPARMLLGKGWGSERIVQGMRNLCWCLRWCAREQSVGAGAALGRAGLGLLGRPVFLGVGGGRSHRADPEREGERKGS